MEVEKEEPLEYWEVAKLLEKRKGDQQKFDTTDQRRVYEFVTTAARLDKDDAEKLLKELVEDLKIPKDIAVQMVYILPLTMQELEPFLKQLETKEGFDNILENRETRDEFIRNLLDVLKKYEEKAKVLIEEEIEEEKEK